MANAGETRSDARMETSEGPRATGTSRPGGLAYQKKPRPGGLSYRTHRNMKHALLNSMPNDESCERQCPKPKPHGEETGPWRRVHSNMPLSERMVTPYTS